MIPANQWTRPKHQTKALPTIPAIAIAAWTMQNFSTEDVKSRKLPATSCSYRLAEGVTRKLPATSCSYRLAEGVTRKLPATSCSYRLAEGVKTLFFLYRTIAGKQTPYLSAIQSVKVVIKSRSAVCINTVIILPR